MNTQLPIPLSKEDPQDADFLPTKIYLKLWFSNGEIKRYQSSSSSRIFRKIKANNFLKGVLKMNYGKRMSSLEKMEEFDNISEPLSKKDLIKVYYTFLGH